MLDGAVEGERLRLLKSDNQCGDDEDEASQRPRNSDIEKLSAIVECRLYSDDGPESAEWVQDWWTWDSIGQGCIDPVVPASEIVSHFMGEQDGENRKREGKTQEELGGIVPCLQ